MYVVVCVNLNDTREIIFVILILLVETRLKMENII